MFVRVDEGSASAHHSHAVYTPSKSQDELRLSETVRDETWRRVWGYRIWGEPAAKFPWSHEAVAKCDECLSCPTHELCAVVKGAAYERTFSWLATVLLSLYTQWEGRLASSKTHVDSHCVSSSLPCSSTWSNCGQAEEKS